MTINYAEKSKVKIKFHGADVSRNYGAKPLEFY